MSVPLNQTDEYDWNGLRDEVFDLKARGYSIEYIARVKGKNPKTIAKILKKDFEERYGNRQQKIEQQVRETDWIKHKAMERISAAKAGWDRRDAELLLKILDREAKLHGLDQPTQHQVTHNIEIGELSNEELDAQLKQFGVSLPEGFLSLPAASEPSELVEDAEFTSVDASVEAIPTNDPTEPPRTGQAEAGFDLRRG